MNEVLTNDYAGMFPAERGKDQSAFFRVMSKMAITEEQSLVRISPASHAELMKHVPSRDDAQIYKADLVCVDIDESAVMFSISRAYGDLGPVGHVYCNGVMAAGDTKDPGVVVSNAVMAASITQAIASGAIESLSAVTASYLSDTEIDYQLDWQQILKTEKLSGASPAFGDVPIRVKSGAERDSYSQWREISPTGISVKHTDEGKSITVHLDTGIICSSTLSAYAPSKIGIDMIGTDTFENYTINLYLNIDDIPSSALPWYVMHPGQYLHEIATEESWSGTAGNDKIDVVGDISSISVEEYVSVTAGGVTTMHLVTEISDNTLTLSMNPGERAFTRNVIVTKTTYTYADGDLFGGEAPADFRTPREARMFILRGSIKLIEQPYIPQYGKVAEIDGLTYHYHSSHDHLYPAYAACHYEVTHADGKYGEVGTIDYDTVESMRYVGHYGRNPVCGGRIVDDNEFGVAVDIETQTSGHSRREIISNMEAASVGKNSVEFNLSNIMPAPTKSVTGVVHNFYFISVDSPPRRTVAQVSMSKVYLTAGMDDKDVYAQLCDQGYVLLKGLLTGSLEGGITAEDVEASLAEAPGINGTVLMGIGDELLYGTVGNGVTDISNMQRGVMGTTPASHTDESPVDIFDPLFKNEFIGRLASVSDGMVRIEGMSSVPDSGYIMIGKEILAYSDVAGEDVPISQRACFGSEQRDLKVGDKATYLSYFSYSDIHLAQPDLCSYSGQYRSRISLPASNVNDPQQYGAIPIYVMEILYETHSKA